MSKHYAFYTVLRTSSMHSEIFFSPTALSHLQNQTKVIIWLDKGHDKHVDTHFNLETIIKNTRLDISCKINSVEAVISCNSNYIKQSKARSLGHCHELILQKWSKWIKNYRAVPDLYCSMSRIYNNVPIEVNIPSWLCILNDFSRKYRIQHHSCWNTEYPAKDAPRSSNL